MWSRDCVRARPEFPAKLLVYMPLEWTLTALGNPRGLQAAHCPTGLANRGLEVLVGWLPFPGHAGAGI
jgi:hypothetical protein